MPYLRVQSPTRAAAQDDNILAVGLPPDVIHQLLFSLSNKDAPMLTAYRDYAGYAECRWR